MRILLVTMDYPPPMGGIQIVAKNLEQDLLSAGHDVYVVNVDGRNSSNYKKVRPIDLFPQRVTQNEHFPAAGVLNPAKILKTGGYRDLVFSNMIHRLAQDARKCFRPDATHILKETLYAAVYECPEPFVVSCHGGESALLENTFPVHYSLTHATRIHCVSNYVRSLVENVVGEGSSHIRVIYNTVDRATFREYDGVKENIIITCCRLVEGKNVDSIIKAIALLPHKIGRHYRYFIVGDGPQLGYLRALAQELKLDNVEFVGEMKDQLQLSRLLGKSKLFVLCPKSYQGALKAAEEGFGISFIEAQACGTPVIASSRGGIPEAVGDGGLLVDDPLNPNEIATKMQRVLQDEALYQELIYNIHNRLSQFDRGRSFSAFERLYTEALETT